MRCRNEPERWGAVSIILHWLTALVVPGLFVMGLWMTDLTYYDRWYHKAPDIHKSVGVLLFFATLGRWVWTLFSPRPNELSSHTPWERPLARLTHVALYLLLFGVMLSGYFISTADGRPVEIFGWFAIPATISGIDGQEDIAGAIHLTLAISLIALVVLHAAAALKHHFLDRDRTLTRMLGR